MGLGAGHCGLQSEQVIRAACQVARDGTELDDELVALVLGRCEVFFKGMQLGEEEVSKGGTGGRSKAWARYGAVEETLSGGKFGGEARLLELGGSEGDGDLGEGAVVGEALGISGVLGVDFVLRQGCLQLSSTSSALAKLIELSRRNGNHRDELRGGLAAGAERNGRALHGSEVFVRNASVVGVSTCRKGQRSHKIKLETGFCVKTRNHFKITSSETHNFVRKFAVQREATARSLLTQARQDPTEASRTIQDVIFSTDHSYIIVFTISYAS